MFFSRKEACEHYELPLSEGQKIIPECDFSQKGDLLRMKRYT